MSHPDYDFPCSRVFWEDDKDYENRRNTMNALKVRLEAIEQSQRARRALIEAGDAWQIATARFLYDTEGGLSDEMYRTVSNARDRAEGYMLALKARYATGVREVSSLRKDLSELTR